MQNTLARNVNLKKEYMKKLYLKNNFFGSFISENIQLLNILFSILYRVEISSTAITHKQQQINLRTDAKTIALHINTVWTF